MRFRQKLTLEQKQVAQLSKRTKIDKKLLNQLPDESLSGYYNRTSGFGTKVMVAVNAFTASAMLLASAISLADEKNIWAGVLFAVSVGIVRLATPDILAVIENKKVGKEIKDEIASILPVQKHKQCQTV